MQMLASHGEITIKAIAEELKVSEMTVHRDVAFLQDQRYAYKKRGAVVYIENTDREATDFYADEKRAIGIKAAALITEGQSVILYFLQIKSLDIDRIKNLQKQALRFLSRLPP